MIVKVGFLMTFQVRSINGDFVFFMSSDVSDWCLALLGDGLKGRIHFAGHGPMAFWGQYGQQAVISTED